MSKSFRFLAAFLFASLFTTAAFAQSITISGAVSNSASKDAIPSVSVTIKGTKSGTLSNDQGKFTLTTSQKLPLVLVFSSIGYETLEYQVRTASESVNISLVPAIALGADVVVSASRVPERILESPVSIERVNLANVRNAPATGYYDIFKNIKGVDMTTSSLFFNTVSTRGFNGSGSARVNQLIDGMDNQAPGLNFSVGSVIGLTELDVESLELLPGASSALYGPGGMNGTLLLNSKNPFKYQGLSYQVKTGIMHVDNSQRAAASPYYDWNVRWAKKINEKAAFKIGAQFIQAKDWVANDSSNYLVGDPSKNNYGKVIGGTRTTDPNYDGVNVYGDETSVDIQPFIQGAIAGTPALSPILSQFLGKPLLVSRTGYAEREIMSNNTMNVKLTGSFHYKFTSTMEGSISAYWGTGSTVYTGSDRYNLKDLRMGQYKLELKDKKWFIKAYTTQENAGESYNSTIAARVFNEAWKPSYNPANAGGSWYPQYVGGFANAAATIFQTVLASGGSLAAAQGAVAAALPNLHAVGRSVADANRPAAGSATFNQLFTKVRSTPIKKGGGLLLDASDLYQADGQYNFSEYFNNAFDLIAGASVKRYSLNSQGTIFADSVGRINIDEVGAYAQISKSYFNGVLKLSASGRYDKNSNFKGRFTPRYTGVIKLAENHHLRASYQTAYRFPTTQNQWINLQVGGGTILLGGLPSLREFYNFRSIKTLNDNPGGQAAYTLESVRAAGVLAAQGNLAGAAGALKEAEFGDYKPESVKSFEVGYKGLFSKKLLIDVYGYVGHYNDFLGRSIVVQALAGPTSVFSSAASRVISVAVNSKTSVRTWGYGASADLLLPRSFVATANVSLDRIDGVEAGFVSFFNTPGYRLNLGLSNTGFGKEKRYGFAVNLRTQDSYFYESDFRQGDLEGYTILDGQVSYKLPKQKTLVKVGGTNLTNKYYKTAFANPGIGAIYYVSIGFNVF